MSKKTHTLKQAYKIYRQNGGIVSYEAYRDICGRFNQMVMDQIIYEGRSFDMGSYLSILKVIRKARNFKKPAINWKASNERRQEIIDEGGTPYHKEDAPEGQKWFIYFTDEWFCMFYWNKQTCKIANKSVYRLDITRGTVGNKTKLINLLQEDDLAYLMYDYFE